MNAASVLILVAVLVGGVGGVAAAAEPRPSEEFERGKTAFGRAEYQRAIQVLRPLLYPEVRLESEGEVVQAHRMLGVAYLFEGRDEEARLEFRKLLELRPDYRFDPLLDPPRVVDFFNGVLKQEEEELAAIEARRRHREAELEARRRREAESLRLQQTTIVRLARHSLAVSFIPFGAGQFQNGHTRKGWWFFGAETVLATASMAAFVTNFALFGVAPRRPCKITPPNDANGLPTRCPEDQRDRSDETLSTNLLRVQLATGGVFFAVAIWGVVDAVRHFQPEVPAAPDPGPARPAVKTSFRLTPIPFGFGATWRF